MITVASIYAEMSHLKARKTVVGLQIFNSLVEAGLVHFLSPKKEEKVIEVSVTELVEARKVAEKVLASARAVKAYRGAVVAKKAAKASRRIFAGFTRKTKGLGIMSLDSLKKAESRAQAAYTALRAARSELQVSINTLAQAKEGDSVRAIYSALKACRLATFKVEQLTVELAFAKEQVTIVAARQAV